MRRSLPQLLFTVLVLGLLLLREARTPPLAGVEETFINWLGANSNGDHTRAPVMLIEINDNCLVDYPWPWSPLNYALFLKGALQFQARATAVEPVLAWDDSKLSPLQLLQQPQFETYLHDYILRTPRLELGAQLGFPADPDVLPPMQPLPVFRNVEGPTESVPEYTVIDSEPGEDIRLTTALGFTNVPPAEPTAQHAPMVFRYRGQMVPSFALQAMMLYHGVTPDEVEVRLGSVIRLGNKLTIPINQAGAMLVDWKQPFDHAGFDDLVLAANQLDENHAPVIDRADLRDRLVILARTDAASQTILLPTGRLGSAGELFAAAIATAETSAFARSSGPVGSAVVLLLGMALGWIVFSRTRLLTVPVAGAFIAGYLLVCLITFESARVALPLTPMLGLIAFIVIFRLLAPRLPEPLPSRAPVKQQSIWQHPISRLLRNLPQKLKALVPITLTLRKPPEPLPGPDVIKGP